VPFGLLAPPVDGGAEEKKRHRVQKEDQKQRDGKKQTRVATERVGRFRRTGALRGSAGPARISRRKIGAALGHRVRIVRGVARFSSLQDQNDR
jgi:hypothetical protein